MGATQAWQQLSFFQGEVSRVFGPQQHQVPATLVHIPEGGEGGDDIEEEQRRRAASRQNGQCQEAALKGFQLVLFLILLSHQGIQVKATETSSTHLQREMEKEADSLARKDV